MLVLGGEGEAEVALQEGVAGAEEQGVLATGGERHLLDVEGLDGSRLCERGRGREHAEEEEGAMIHGRLGEEGGCGILMWVTNVLSGCMSYAQQ
jgi:hypothetical protein